MDMDLKEITFLSKGMEVILDQVSSKSENLH